MLFGPSILIKICNHSIVGFAFAPGTEKPRLRRVTHLVSRSAEQAATLESLETQADAFSGPFSWFWERIL